MPQVIPRPIKRRKINPIRKAKLKQALLKGTNVKQALKDAGYSDNTAHHSTTLNVVQCCFSEIAQRFKESDLTIDFVLKGVFDTIQKAIDKGDNSTAMRGYELLGKKLAIWITKEQTEDITDKATTGDLRRSIGSAMDYMEKGQEN